METTIKQRAGLSNTTYHKRCTSDGQRRWWLRDAAGNFVTIGSHRGDRDLEVTLNLAPGRYTLGCGPAGSHGYRTVLVVNEAAS